MRSNLPHDHNGDREASAEWRPDSMRDRIARLSRRLQRSDPARVRFTPSDRPRLDLTDREFAPLPSPIERARAQSRRPWRFTPAKLMFLIVVILPTALASIYFGLIASDRFVAESSFVVRSAKQPLGGGLGSLLQMTGIARSQDDAYSVQEYIQSRDAVAALSQRLNLREIFARPGADFLARFPNPISGDTEEEMFQHYKGMVEAIHVATTGITTLRVQAFRPEDALVVNRTLLTLGEELVNRMNERIRSDAVRFAESEVNRSQQRLVETQIKITEFRNRELMLDPSKSSLIVAELIGRLSAELAIVTAQLREVEAASANSPQIPGLQRRAAALESQIALERARVSGTSDGLASKIADFERLNLERDFAVKALTSAVASLELARNEVRRQQLYLERVVEPHAADYASEPRRLKNIFVSLAASVLVFFIIWLFTAGIKEHQFGGR